MYVRNGRVLLHSRYGSVAPDRAVPVLCSSTSYMRIVVTTSEGVCVYHLLILCSFLWFVRALTLNE